MNTIDMFKNNSVFALLCAVVVLLAGCGGATSEPQTRLSAVEATSGNSAAGFAKVLQPRPFAFPRDHGPHQEYATEWWYYTGNLDSTDGRHFGYQLTFFRFGLTPTPAERQSSWATANIYMAHFALSDVANRKFYAFQKLGRNGADLAGAQGEPQFRVWLEDWMAEGSGAEGLPMRLRAEQDGVAIDVVLHSDRPVVLQGDKGLSQKSATPGNASYYYSYTRMPTTGSVTVGGQQTEVRGNSWMDREWGTTALDAGATGWDWFALQLDDGRDIMFYRIRNTNPANEYRFGTLVEPDGTVRTVNFGQAQLEQTGTWRSPDSGIDYPSGWRLQLPDVGIDLTITPYLPNQELPLVVRYWEGAAQIQGSVNGAAVRGNGYVELTGYGEQSDVRVR